MATENYTNNYTVATASSITSSGTSLSVSLAAPIDGGFRILIESELLLVTSGGTTTTWTVTRGIEGTTGASHGSGIDIKVVLTAGALDALRTQFTAVGLFADLPVSGMKSGDQYWCTDTSNNYVYDGTDWVAFGITLPLTLTPGGSPSYSNTFGSGDRSATISLTATPRGGTGNWQSMVNGNTSNNPSMTDWFINSGNNIVFDFGTPQLITEVTFYDHDSQGTSVVAQWQGSNDNSTYTAVGGNTTYGPETSNPIVDTTLSGNTNYYRYYKWILQTTTGNIRPAQFLFKILQSSATVAALDVGGKATFGGQVEFGGDILIDSGNNLTGSTTPTMGTNSPSTGTTPYTWIRYISSDGSTVWVPAWK